MSGLYDDLVPQTAPAVAPTQVSGLYDDLVPPAAVATKQAPPITTMDRAQAINSGLRKGAAYLATMLPDAVGNVYELGKAAIGTGYGLTHTTETQDPENLPNGLYHYVRPDGVEVFSKTPPQEGSKPVMRSHTDIPSSLDVSGPSPVGAALTGQMDRSALTTTQPRRPDDALSRYLNTAASVVPGAVAGGAGAIGATARGVAEAVPGALGAQYVAEAKPFQSDTANNAAAVLTQALLTGAAPRGRGAPLVDQANDAVRAGQQKGYVFPPAATNPNLATRFLSGMAGKSAVDQHAAVENQPATNNLGRAAMGLPEKEGPISDLEIAKAKAQAAPGYDALRGAGQIPAPQTQIVLSGSQATTVPGFADRLDAAISGAQGAARLAPSLKDAGLDRIVGELKNNQSFDAGDAMDTISALRDKASAAYRAGDAGTGKAYRAVSNVLEDALDQHLASNPATANLLQKYRDSRQRFAAIADVEENRNVGTGNVLANKLAAALQRGDYLGGPGAPLDTAARSAMQAPKAFAEPNFTTGSGHLGFWGSLIAAPEIGHLLPFHDAGLAALGGTLAYHGSRAAALKAALGAPGQALAIRTGKAPFPAARLAAALTSAPGVLAPVQ